MFQQLTGVPVQFANGLTERKREWERFENGTVSLQDCPHALRASFPCDMEITVADEQLIRALQLPPTATGTLHITAQRLYWITSDVGETGFAVDYPDVLLHAISRPEDRPSLYLQVNLTRVLDESGTDIATSDEFDSDDEESRPYAEIILAPHDATTVDEMFLALSECAALHPDADDNDSSDEMYTGALVCGVDDSEEPVSGNDSEEPASGNDSEEPASGGDSEEPARKLNRLDASYDDRFEDAAEH